MNTKLRKKYCGAVDVGGTKISSALFTSDGQISHREKITIDKSKPENSVRQVIEIIKGLEGSARSENGTILSVGIVIPGIVFQQRKTVWAPNIPGWEHFPLQKMIQEETRLPLVFDSDRSAYVLGEQWCGIARDMKDVVFLAVGTGIGAGIIVDGRLCRGSEDIAGAVGWFALDPQFKREYSLMGCFEAEASGNSVARKAIQHLKSGESSILNKVRGNIEQITAQDVFEAAQKKDPLSEKIIRATIEYLGMGIANIVSILNPQIVVLGGGLFQSARRLLNPVRKEVEKWAQPLSAQKVRIELTHLGEDAGLYGAGKLAWESG
ncbi:MAG: ROK family protein [Candidatus Aminicenantes bacterium]|nr:ROK family protein [Candidatus Aminicenantes bacterium]